MSKVELLDYFGGDEMVVDTARVSYGKKAENYKPEQNDRLIKYLAEHGHTSPFRHPKLRFRIKVPIYVERQMFKHTVGIDANSISGRYVDFSDSYHKIEQFRTQAKDSKQGSGDDLCEEDNYESLMIQDFIIEACKTAYQKLIDFGVAKEQARSVLPLSLETEFIWTGSFQAFAHLCHLRLKSDTQKETRDVVTEMLELVKQIEGNPFKESLKAFNL